MLKILLNVIISLVAISGGIINKNIIQNIIAKTSSITEITGFYILCIIIAFVLSSINNLISTIIEYNLAIKIDYDLSNVVFEKMSEKSINTYENKESREDMCRAMLYFHKSSIASVNIISYFIGNLILLCSIIFVRYDIAVLIFAFLLSLNSIFFGNKLNKHMYSLSEEEIPINRLLGYLKNIFTVFSFGKDLRLYKDFNLLLNNKYKDILLEKEKINTDNNLKKIHDNNWGNIAPYSMAFLFLLYLLHKVAKSEYTVDEFVFMFSIFTALIGNLQSLLKTAPDLRENSLYINSIKKYINSDVSKKYKYEIRNDEDINIELKNLSFYYPNAPGKYIVNNINIKISQGEKVAIIGQNGAGKSTLIKLLLNFYEPADGNILINDFSYGDINPTDINNIYSAVFQRFHVLAFSIAENVLMREAENKEDEELVWDALTFCGLNEKVKKMPENIYTKVTEDYYKPGVFLSGGEQQLLAIARAYAKKGKIIILDEPTSQLDPITEKMIIDKFMKLGDGRTVIIITHRLTFMERMDKIYLLEGNAILQSGRHNELLSGSLKYREMYYSSGSYQ